MAHCIKSKWLDEKVISKSSRWRTRVGAKARDSCTRSVEMKLDDRRQQKSNLNSKVYSRCLRRRARGYMLTRSRTSPRAPLTLPLSNATNVR